MADVLRCGRCLGVIDERGGDICDCREPSVPMNERAAHELGRLRALERALRGWVAGEIPRGADSVTLLVDGEEFNFHRSVLGRNPNEVAATIGDLDRASKRLYSEVSQARAALRGLYDAGTSIAPEICADPDHDHDHDAAEEAVRAYLVARAVAKGVLDG